MITMQDQLEPAVRIDYAAYVPAVIIDWLHGEKRELYSQDQIVPSNGPTNVIPTAVFTIGGQQYDWDLTEW